MEICSNEMLIQSTKLTLLNNNCLITTDKLQDMAGNPWGEDIHGNKRPSLDSIMKQEGVVLYIFYSIQSTEKLSL